MGTIQNHLTVAQPKGGHHKARTIAEGDLQIIKINYFLENLIIDKKRLEMFCFARRCRHRSLFGTQQTIYG